MSNKQSFIFQCDASPTQSTTVRLCVCVCLVIFVGVTADSRAASLFGDFSCTDWGNLEYSRKKNWANAFLAPLSLTIQGLKRAEQDPYNDDPNAVEPAIRSINEFCLLHPHEGASDGAASYISKLTRN